ncbi:FAD-binding oxidoreductase [Homoserinimonas sp. OAct 916]|uniref:FAD-binding oxidoreductase n=1 Tax=Homoserinimonas sp. OAct 916 TaxID=2211450 RepID=UPI000DBE5E96|nr:FAD-binding oxidoreductase [Homoserinimonas sp. OAct 916]
MSTIHDSALDELQSTVRGPVFQRGDDGLAAEAAGFNAITMHNPDFVVGATNEADVQAAVRFAAARSLPVFAQATGHGAAQGLTHGVLVLTHRMNSVTIDPVARIATIGAGARWTPVVAAAAEYGLMPISGSTPDVGAVGFTMGGGLSPVGRTFGFACDWVRSFRVVTADGEAVAASITENPDLFWALKGGKWGLGVVTEMRTELLPLTSVYGGGLFFDTEHIEAAFRAWADWTKNVSDSVSSSVALIRFPDLEMAPPPLRGKFLLHLRFAYVGEEGTGTDERAAEAERILTPLRQAAPVYLDLVGELPTSELKLIHSDPDGPLPAWERGVLLADIDQEFVTALLSQVGAGTEVPLLVVECRHLGGAMARAPEAGDAAGGRGAAYTCYTVGAPVPELFEHVIPGVAAGMFAAVEPWTSVESNVNFAGPMSMERLASIWPPATSTRLAGVRSQYDPTSVFALPF